MVTINPRVFEIYAVLAFTLSLLPYTKALKYDQQNNFLPLFTVLSWLLSTTLYAVLVLAAWSAIFNPIH